LNLMLFSTSYPYISGGESNFLNTEVGYLIKTFDRVIVVPENYPSQAPVNDYVGAEVNLSYAGRLKSCGMHDLFSVGISSGIFCHGMREKNFPRLSPTAWRRLIAFAGKAEITRRWVLDWFHMNNFDEKDWLFYTYWFDHAAVGIGTAKRELPDLRLVSRVHGYDLYEEQYYKPPFWPCREQALSLVERLFPDSESGLNYLKNHYAEYSGRYETSLLGVSDPGFVTAASTDGVFRIASCSMIRREKRVEHLLESVLYAARLRPHQKFEWFHFGDGASREKLQCLADQQFPSNARAYFPGYSDSKTLMRYYRDQPFDLFVNISETEGTSVSIMEAISCGMPVLATAVGGNTEIVSGENGILLNADPSLSEVASAFFQFIDNTQQTAAKKQGSRRVWKTKYNADTNYPLFARRLRSIRAMVS